MCHFIKYPTKICPFDQCSDHALLRYDEYYRRLDSGYPRHIRNWRGVPSDIDGVITWTDGSIN